MGQCKRAYKLSRIRCDQRSLSPGEDLAADTHDAVAVMIVQIVGEDFFATVKLAWEPWSSRMACGKCEALSRTALQTIILEVVLAFCWRPACAGLR